MIRRTRAGRYVATLLVFAAGCGAAPSPVATLPTTTTTTTEEEASPGNTNHVVAVDETPDTAAAAAPLVAEEPSIAGVYLWCELPTGSACLRASAILGTGPKDPSGLPPALLGVEDLGNDCDEPTIAEVAGRLSRAFGVSPSGWRDQGGSYLDASSLSQMYQAAGCINDAEAGRPIAKIHAAAGSSPRAYLVRVWEIPAPPTVQGQHP